MNQTLNSSINFKTVVKVAEGLIASDMDGEKVVLSVSNGKYYNLEVIGGRIWDLLVEPQGVSDIVDALLEEYQIDCVACEEDVIAFLNQVYEEGLIQTC
jgi:hypothetical protein